MHRSAVYMDVHIQNSVEIYVRLLGEGTEVFRPTQAMELDNGLFRLEAAADYDPEDEFWEFLPGSDVRGEIQPLDSGLHLVALSATKPA
jgi:hypothetical protein